MQSCMNKTVLPKPTHSKSSQNVDPNLSSPIAARLNHRAPCQGLGALRAGWTLPLTCHNHTTSACALEHKPSSV